MQVLTQNAENTALKLKWPNEAGKKKIDSEQSS